MDSALLLRQYLDIYGTYTLAFKRYKGYSALGEKQAKHVIAIMNSML